MVAREFYLGAAVLSCIILGLRAQASYCPSCSAGGKDKHAALTACNEKVVDQVCDEVDGPAVCEIVLNVFRSGRARVNRWCSTEGRHNEQNQLCKQRQKSGRGGELNCSLLRAICTESGCNATLPDSVVFKGERRDFLRAFYLAHMRKKAAEN